MTEKRHSRTGLLLTELILAILFYSVAAACCLRTFAEADRLSRRAKQLKMAVNSTENLLQQLKAVEGEERRLKEFYPEAEHPEEGILYFDREGHSCPAIEQDYSVSFQVIRKRVTAETEVTCRNTEGEEIYSLSTVLVLRMEYE